MADEVEVEFEEDQQPLGIVFRSTVPAADGRAFAKDIKANTPAARHKELCAAKTAAERAGLCLVLTAVDGVQVKDTGVGLFNAGVERIQSACRSRKAMAELRRRLDNRELGADERESVRQRLVVMSAMGPISLRLRAMWPHSRQPQVRHYVRRSQA